MPYWLCHYHIVWATYQRMPVISQAFEKLIFEAVRRRSAEMDCAVLAVNGVADHIHVAVCVKPSISVAQWVGQIKGASSHVVNVTYADASFRWQESYGVLTFGQRNLEMVRAYIEQQKQHHAENTLMPALERIDEK